MGLVVVASTTAVRASETSRTYLIAIGVNTPPAGGAPNAGPLSYADDDAAAIEELGQAIGATTFLLTAPDKATLARFPSVHSRVRPATEAEIERVIGEVTAAIAADKQRQIPADVILFYSGHGTQGESGEPFLTLTQGSLSHRFLFDTLLPRLPVRNIHLIVDACHAEAVVRPRDAAAVVGELSESDIGTKLLRGTLRGFPQAGAVLASTGSTQSHEWDQYEHGVFTYELLAGLRGAADVNVDGRVEYSEIAAFLAAANRRVTQLQARLITVATPPRDNPRTALVDWTKVAKTSFLLGKPQPLGRLVVETAHGRRLADLHAESGFQVRLVVPSGIEIFVRTSEREARFVSAPAATTRLEDLKFRDRLVRPRGSIDQALRGGLFADAFGPSYYRGFVDQSPNLVPVELRLQGDKDGVSDSDRGQQPPSQPQWRRPAGWVALVSGGGLLFGSGYYGNRSLDARSRYLDASFQREWADARDDYGRSLGTTIGLAAGAVVSLAVSYWLLR